MKFRNTLVLFILLAALGTYVYLVEVKKHQKTEEAKKESKKVFSLQQDSLQSINFQNVNGTFTVKKIQGQWKITDPLYTEADESTVNSMLSSLLAAEKDNEFNIDPRELADYGLDDRAIFVRLETNAGEKDSIRMGDNTPVGSFVFSNKADSLVFTIGQSVKNNFSKKLFDIRDKKILHFKRADVQQIMMQNSFGKFDFEKINATDWTLRNINRPADNTKISAILSKLENNRIKEFVDEEGSQLKKYGLDKPAYQIDLSLGQELGQKRLFISRAVEKKYYARDESRRPIFEVDSFLVKDINQKITDFRSKDLASFNRSDINRISVEYADTLFSCIKDTAGNWFLEDSARQALQQQKISSFFSNLDYTSVSEFIKDGSYDPSSYGLDRPQLKLTLFKDADLQLEVKLGKNKDKNIYAATNQYQSVYLIADSKLKELKLKLSDIIEQPVNTAQELEPAQ
jgi:hypothetical protein